MPPLVSTSRLPTKPTVLASDLWHVEFTRRGDRLAHVISKVVDGQMWPLLSSIEGTPSDEWPPSPPLQEMHFESREGVELALPVGMAGKSHWSISIELCAATGRLTFDVACRVRTVPDFLGSSYTIIQPAAGSGGQSVPGWKLDIEPIDGQLASQIRRSAKEVSITAASAVQRVPTTVRWRYVLSADK
jgi:hypothetical protein